MAQAVPTVIKGPSSHALCHWNQPGTTLEIIPNAFLALTLNSCTNEQRNPIDLPSKSSCSPSTAVALQLLILWQFKALCHTSLWLCYSLYPDFASVWTYISPLCSHSSHSNLSKINSGPDLSPAQNPSAASRTPDMSFLLSFSQGHFPISTTPHSINILR